MHLFCLDKGFNAIASLSKGKKVKKHGEKDPKSENNEYYRTIKHPKKNAVIGEIETTTVVPIYEKDTRTKEMIKKAILNNKFLAKLTDSQIEQLAMAMYPQNVKGNTRLIHEGDIGSHLYVSEEGKFEIYEGKTYYGEFGRGVAFGELALLYNTKRLCSIDVQFDGKVWMLDRQTFHTIITLSIKETMEHNLRLLRRIPVLEHLPQEALLKISDLIVVEFFTGGTCIVREGEPGDKFYIINCGSVRITKRNAQGREEEMMILEEGDYFGEKALYEDEEHLRQASALALPPGVECFTIDRRSR